MLRAAGVDFVAEAPRVDESALTESLIAAGARPRDIADSLAEMKAVRVSQRYPQALVLGGDSVAALEDGTLLDKSMSRDEAAAQLRRLSGTRHQLISAAVIAEGGRPVWRHVGEAELVVRSLSDAFIAAYLDREWPAIQACVGGYRLEAMGAQLFERVSGDYFVVLGLPLLPVLDYLRIRGVLLA